MREEVVCVAHVLRYRLTGCLAGIMWGDPSPSLLLHRRPVIMWQTYSHVKNKVFTQLYAVLWKNKYTLNVSIVIKRS